MCAGRDEPAVCAWQIVGVAAESLCWTDGCATYRRAVGPVGWSHLV